MSSESEGGAGDHPNAGERGIPSIHRARSLQSRFGNLLAALLITAIGLGLLIWYYSRAIDRPARAHREAEAAVLNRAKGDSTLPSLGPIPEPRVPVPETDTQNALDAIFGPKPPPPPGERPSWIRVDNEEGKEKRASIPEPGFRPVSPSQDAALKRRLGGAVFSSALTASSSPALPLVSATASESELETLLTPSVSEAAQALVLPTQRWLLPKGAFIDCTLETAIDSSLPGMTTCITASDTFGADGHVVLLERGTKLVGETRGRPQQGTHRIFVVWTEARTPTGVVVPLDSPGTDELGRSGLPGHVQRHFWERFGAATLVSMIDGAIQRAQRSRGGDTVILNPSGSREIATEILKDTVRIPPTVIKPQGDRIQVLVARDLDFRTVYALRAAAAGH